MTQPDLVTGVVRAVAAADGLEPEEVPPLGDYIDPGILRKLDDQGQEGNWQFTFLFSDHRVTVTHDAKIFVDGEPHSRDALTE